MTNDAIKHDARYADFAARMLAALASEEASIARRNAKIEKCQAQSSDTVRPSK